MKDLAIVPLAAEVIHTVDRDDELDAPNLIFLNHGPDNKSNISDDYYDDYDYDDIGQNDFLFLQLSSIETMYLMMKILMTMHYKNMLIKWILKCMMQLLMRTRSVCNKGLKS